MTTEQMREQIEAAINIAVEGGNIDVESTVSFADAGIMTMNEGIVAHSADGSVFQISIVQVR